jgi:hypothetical protein
MKRLKFRGVVTTSSMAQKRFEIPRIVELESFAGERNMTCWRDLVVPAIEATCV